MRANLRVNLRVTRRLYFCAGLHSRKDAMSSDNRTYTRFISAQLGSVGETLSLTKTEMRCRGAIGRDTFDNMMRGSMDVFTQDLATGMRFLCYWDFAPNKETYEEMYGFAMRYAHPQHTLARVVNVALGATRELDVSGCFFARVCTPPCPRVSVHVAIPAEKAGVLEHVAWPRASRKRKHDQASAENGAAGAADTCLFRVDARCTDRAVPVDGAHKESDVVVWLLAVLCIEDIYTCSPTRFGVFSCIATSPPADLKHITGAPKTPALFYEFLRSQFFSEHRADYATLYLSKNKCVTGTIVSSADVGRLRQEERANELRRHSGASASAAAAHTVVDFHTTVHFSDQNFALMLHTHRFIRGALSVLFLTRWRYELRSFVQIPSFVIHVLHAFGPQAWNEYMFPQGVGRARAPPDFHPRMYVNKLFETDRALLYAQTHVHSSDSSPGETVRAGSAGPGEESTAESCPFADYPVYQQDILAASEDDWGTGNAGLLFEFPNQAYIQPECTLRYTKSLRTAAYLDSVRDWTQVKERFDSSIAGGIWTGTLAVYGPVNTQMLIAIWMNLTLQETYVTHKRHMSELDPDPFKYVWNHALIEWKNGTIAGVDVVNDHQKLAVAFENYSLNTAHKSIYANVALMKLLVYHKEAVALLGEDPRLYRKVVDMFLEHRPHVIAIFEYVAANRDELLYLWKTQSRQVASKNFTPVPAIMYSGPCVIDTAMAFVLEKDEIYKAYRLSRLMDAARETGRSESLGALFIFDVPGVDAAVQEIEAMAQKIVYIDTCKTGAENTGIVCLKQAGADVIVFGQIELLKRIQLYTTLTALIHELSKKWACDVTGVCAYKIGVGHIVTKLLYGTDMYAKVLAARLLALLIFRKKNEITESDFVAPNSEHHAAHYDRLGAFVTNLFTTAVENMPADTRRTSADPHNNLVSTLPGIYHTITAVDYAPHNVVCVESGEDAGVHIDVTHKTYSGAILSYLLTDREHFITFGDMKRVYDAIVHRGNDEPGIVVTAAESVSIPGRHRTAFAFMRSVFAEEERSRELHEENAVHDLTSPADRPVSLWYMDKIYRKSTSAMTFRPSAVRCCSVDGVVVEEDGKITDERRATARFVKEYDAQADAAYEKKVKRRIVRKKLRAVVEVGVIDKHIKPKHVLLKTNVEKLRIASRKYTDVVRRQGQKKRAARPHAKYVTKQMLASGLVLDEVVDEEDVFADVGSAARPPRKHQAKARAHEAAPAASKRNAVDLDSLGLASELDIGCLVRGIHMHMLFYRLCTDTELHPHLRQYLARAIYVKTAAGTTLFKPAYTRQCAHDKGLYVTPAMTVCEAKIAVKGSDADCFALRCSLFSKNVSDHSRYSGGPGVQNGTKCVYKVLPDNKIDIRIENSAYTPGPDEYCEKYPERGIGAYALEHEEQWADALAAQPQYAKPNEITTLVNYIHVAEAMATFGLLAVDKNEYAMLHATRKTPVHTGSRLTLDALSDILPYCGVDPEIAASQLPMHIAVTSKHYLLNSFMVHAVKDHARAPVMHGRRSARAAETTRSVASSARSDDSAGSGALREYSERDENSSGSESSSSGSRLSISSVERAAQRNPVAGRPAARVSRRDSPKSAGLLPALLPAPAHAPKKSLGDAAVHNSTPAVATQETPASNAKKPVRPTSTRQYDAVVVDGTTRRGWKITYNATISELFKLCEMTDGAMPVEASYGNILTLAENDHADRMIVTMFQNLGVIGENHMYDSIDRLDFMSQNKELEVIARFASLGEHVEFHAYCVKLAMAMREKKEAAELAQNGKDVPSRASYFEGEGGAGGNAPDPEKSMEFMYKKYVEDDVYFANSSVIKNM